MNRTRIAPTVRWGLVVLAQLAGSGIPAFAQDRPSPSFDLTAGWVGFPDEGIVSEGLAGGALRWYVHPRMAIGPEVVYIHGDNHGHLVITGNLTWDLLSPANRPSHHVTPFLVIGGGLFQTRYSFPVGSFVSREGAFTAGGGVRADVGDRFTVGIDARVGWELHVRVAGLVGLRLSR